MRIAFYADHRKWSQLANNGGTRTILLSSKVLNDLGHLTVVVAHKDRFSWFKHPKPVHSIPKYTDAVVAVTISDVAEVLAGRVRGRIKTERIAYWARPYETWQMPEDDIFRLLKKFVKADGVVMVNSEWQQGELLRHEIPAAVVYQGYDHPPGGPDPGGPWERPWYIGCQYSTKWRKRWRMFADLHHLLGDRDYRYVAFGEEPCKEPWVERYLRRPSPGDLDSFYRGCHYFFCPNILEGLYNCAIEASLRGCLLVVANEPRNGMMDYCDGSTAVLFDDLSSVEVAMSRADRALVERCQRTIVDVIGTRERNMRRMVEVLSA